MYPNCNVGGASFSPYYQSPMPMQATMQQSPLYTNPNLRGMVVSRVEDIKPSDVPMDGTSGVFPLQDRSAIYVKSWNSDGTIRTTKYIPEESTIIEETPMDMVEYLDKRFEEVLDALKKESEAVG